MPTTTKKKPEGLTAGIGLRPLIARINRKLRQKGRLGWVLKTSRSQHAEIDLGRYFIVDMERNFIEQHHVDVEKLARELGVLAPWERLVED